MRSVASRLLQAAGLGCAAEQRFESAAATADALLHAPAEAATQAQASAQRRGFERFLACQRARGQRQMFGDIAGGHADRAARPGGAIARVGVQVDAERGRVEWREPLGDQRPDRAGQDVAGACGASAGCAISLTRARPSGAAITVFAPLSTTTASHSAAELRVRSSRAACT